MTPLLFIFASSGSPSSDISSFLPSEIVGLDLLNQIPLRETFSITLFVLFFAAAIFERLIENTGFLSLEDQSPLMKKFPLNLIIFKGKLSHFTIRAVSILSALFIGHLTSFNFLPLSLVLILYFSSFLFSKKILKLSSSKTIIYSLSWLLSVPFLILYSLSFLCLRKIIQADDNSSNFEMKQIRGEMGAVSDDRELLHKDEQEMMQGVCEFAGTVVREVMTPRTDLEVIPLDATYSEIIKTVKDSGYSRFPVIKDKLDDVEGILLAKDLIGLPFTKGGDLEKNFKVSEIMREPYFVPDNKPIDSLLAEFKKRKHHLAIVLDEHGGVDGIASLEDLIEEIVGEIFDESDDLDDPEIKVEDSGEVVLDGGVLVDDLNEKFALKIPLGDYDTVAGFMLSRLGRMPKEGDEVSIQDLDTKIDSLNLEVTAEPSKENCDAELSEIAGLNILIVKKIDGHRIETIKLISEQFTSI